MNPKKKDVYGPNFQKAKRHSIARSSGKCQLCGLRKAEEGHHWAWPDYPSDEDVQPHDITALCKPCHEFATLLRDWTQRKGANFDVLALDLNNARSFFEKREIFSYWLFPEDQEDQSFTYHGQVESRKEPVSYTATTYKGPKKTKRLRLRLLAIHPRHICRALRHRPRCTRIHLKPKRPPDNHQRPFIVPSNLTTSTASPDSQRSKGIQWVLQTLMVLQLIPHSLNILRTNLL